MEATFIDTNIFVYALDRDAGAKHEKAKALLKPYYTEDVKGVISIQVIQEYASRLYRWGWEDEAVALMLEPLRYWPIVRNDLALLEEGLRLKKRFQLSYWDAFILAAACTAGVNTLLSEAFSNGQVYGQVEVVNPFTS